MISGLIREIDARGDRGAVVPFSRVDDIKADLLALKAGEDHPSWLDRMVNHMTGKEDKFIPRDIDFVPRSLISVVMPSPKAVLQFCYRGETIPCVVPPHYTNLALKNERALRYIRDYLAPLGFSAAIVHTFPQKLLAVHCGLARYGRNNIGYHDEFGSYMQIMTYISDLPCDDAAWFPIGRMDRCGLCHACVDACPTGAIDLNRRLINSDRCITFVNESPGEFPEWLGRDAHNSITGCTKCQDCCPGNARNSNNIDMGIAFTEAETTALLQRGDGATYAGSLAAKLEATGISPEFMDSFPRNLAALLQKAHPKLG